MSVHTSSAIRTSVYYTVAMKLGMVGVGVVGVLVGIAIGWLLHQRFGDTSSGTLEEALPVVAFRRPGLLSARDRELLQARVIEPIIDYNNETELKLVTMSVTVPAKSGEEYTVESFFLGGGFEGMIWGKRDGEIPYWRPNCLGPCEFGEAFRAKHPEVVKAATPN